MTTFLADLANWQRVALVVAVAVGAHLLVYLVRASATRAMTSAVDGFDAAAKTVVGEGGLGAVGVDDALGAALKRGVFGDVICKRPNSPRKKRSILLK